MNSISIVKKSPLATAWQMLICLLAAQLVVSFVGRSLAPLTVLISNDLSLTHAQVGLLPAALFFGQSLAAIPSGISVDRIGSKKQLLIVTIILALGFVMIAKSNAFLQLLLFVVIAGGAYGAMHPTTNRGILYWFPQHKRGIAMGIKQMGITVGSALAAIVLIPLAASIGWRVALMLSCGLLLLIGIISSLYYRDPVLKKEKTTSPEKVSLIKQFHKMLKNKPLLLISISAMGLQGVQLCLTTYIVLFAFDQLSFSLVTAGALLVIAEIGGSIGRVGWGAISDVMMNGKRMPVMYLVTIITACCILLMTYLQPGTSFLYISLLVFIVGFCISGYNGVWMNIVTELVPKEESGLATGITITISSWGVMIVPPFFGFLVDSSGTFSAGWLFLVLLMGGISILLRSTSVAAKKLES